MDELVIVKFLKICVQLFEKTDVRGPFSSNGNFAVKTKDIEFSIVYRSHCSFINMVLYPASSTCASFTAAVYPALVIAVPLPFKYN
ncbi:hypothetical protein Tco_0054201 [Tanacetum coccineum]